MGGHARDAPRLKANIIGYPNWVLSRLDIKVQVKLFPSCCAKRDSARSDFLKNSEFRNSQFAVAEPSGQASSPPVDDGSLSIKIGKQLCLQIKIEAIEAIMWLFEVGSGCFLTSQDSHYVFGLKWNCVESVVFWVIPTRADQGSKTRHTTLFRLFEIVLSFSRCRPQHFVQVPKK